MLHAQEASATAKNAQHHFLRLVPVRTFSWGQFEIRLTDHARSDRKKRCSFAPSQDSCRECVSRNLPCSLKKPNVPRGLAQRHRPIASGPTTSSESPTYSEDGGLPYNVIHDDSLCDDLISRYFDLIHDKQHLIFHPATFLAQYRAGKIQKYLVWIIAALISRCDMNSSDLDVAV